MRLRALAVTFVILTAATLSAQSTSGYSARTPFGTWEVPIGDLGALGSPRTEVVVKSFSPGMNVVKYLDAAASHGQKVVAYFTDTVDYGSGTVHPDRVDPWVQAVKSHPALYGYLSVKEPSWSGISVSEMRSLYSAYRAADPDHPVIALLGDIPHFGSSANPWASGIANILWVDWYPVTYSRGYIDTASKWFPKVRSYVNSVTPGTPIWLMVQGHGYKAGDRRTPTSAELVRQVSDGFHYLKADGIVFYTWSNPLYDKDLKRNPSLWSTARQIVSEVRAGTFGTTTATPKPSATPKPTATPKPAATTLPVTSPSAMPTALASTPTPASTPEVSASTATEAPPSAPAGLALPSPAPTALILGASDDAERGLPAAGAALAVLLAAALVVLVARWTVARRP
jgi:hypothetical protein